MSNEQNNQPAAEGSAPEMVKEGPLGDGMDAKPAAEQEAPEVAEAIAEAFAGGDAEKAEEAVEKMLDEAKAEFGVKAVPSLADELKAAVEKLASMYGVPHDGDHESTAKKLAAYMGHAADDLETLIGKLRQHAGL